MRKEDEQILVLPRELVVPKPWRGINPDGVIGFENLVRENALYKRRGDMEEDPNFKQLIPYVVFRHDSKYFLMQRTDNAGEQRLKNKFSLGIGGHVREEDLKTGEMISNWALREFHEEVNYRDSGHIKRIGLLNDDADSVGQVHLGYVLLMEGDSDQIAVKDEHKSGTLLTLSEMARYEHQMETWSQLVVDYLRRNNG